MAESAAYFDTDAKSSNPITYVWHQSITTTIQPLYTFLQMHYRQPSARGKGTCPPLAFFWLAAVHIPMCLAYFLLADVSTLALNRQQNAENLILTIAMICSGSVACYFTYIYTQRRINVGERRHLPAEWLVDIKSLLKDVEGSYSQDIEVWEPKPSTQETMMELCLYIVGNTTNTEYGFLSKLYDVSILTAKTVSAIALMFMGYIALGNHAMKARTELIVRWIYFGFGFASSIGSNVSNGYAMAWRHELRTYGNKVRSRIISEGGEKQGSPDQTSRQWWEDQLSSLTSHTVQESARKEQAAWLPEYIQEMC